MEFNDVVHVADFGSAVDVVASDLCALLIDTAMQPDCEANMKLPERCRTWFIEAAIGLGLAGLAVIVAWAATGEVPFVYRGL